MSILIRGVEMPAEGVFCVDIFPDGRVAGHYDCTIKQAKAVPVPPHGDLIDKDETMNAILEERGEDTACWFAGIVNDMPAIIPSDKAEEGET